MPRDRSHAPQDQTRALRGDCMNPCVYLISHCLDVVHGPCNRTSASTASVVDPGGGSSDASPRADSDATSPQGLPAPAPRDAVALPHISAFSLPTNRPADVRQLWLPASAK